MIEVFGGPDRDRTDDLFHAMEARSQLRHRPTLGGTRLFSRMRRSKSTVHGESIVDLKILGAGTIFDDVVSKFP
jgi:hypothetical protein